MREIDIATPCAVTGCSESSEQMRSARQRIRLYALSMRNWSQSSTSGYGTSERGGWASSQVAMLYRRHAFASAPTSPYFAWSHSRKRSAVAGQKQYAAGMLHSF